MTDNNPDNESIKILNSLISPDGTKPKVTIPTTASAAAAAASAVTSPKTTDQSESDKLNNIHLSVPTSGGCPFMSGNVTKKQHSIHKNPEWQTSISIASEPVFYSDYLCLDKILTSQFPVSAKYGNLAHDEHLFIVVHQTYELWFKQIIFELDSIIDKMAKILDERCILVVVQRLQRINLIWRIMNDQIQVLETMAPTDFLDFRGYLSSASGFQSLQFRLFENKVGMQENLRIKYNQKRYDYVFTENTDLNRLENSEKEPTLLKSIDAWLSRTPGLSSFDKDNGQEVDNILLKQYEQSVIKYLTDTYVTPAEEETCQEDKQALLLEYRKTLDSFETIFSAEKHNKLMDRGERKLSHKALWGALMIWLNRDEPRFHLPYQLLSSLTDLDAIMNRWRYNHALLAQKQVGNKAGTGGSSGYSYLRSTASDRYKIFNDIVNLSTWIIPREYVPKLSEELRKRLNSYAEN